MNKVKNRTLFALVLVLALLIGIAAYLGAYVNDGAMWASFGSNRSVYSGGIVTRGQIVDRNGVVLLQNTGDGKVYHSDPVIRTATLHITGDKNGNIGTSIARKYASILSGFDHINGTYAFSDKGASVKVTLDAELCADAYTALAGRSGSILIYNYETGEILCMVSAPAFDPENIPADLETNPIYSGAYLNRALSSVFTPGSIFKVFTTACGLDTFDDLLEREYLCEGTYIVDGKAVNCMHTHGTIKLKDALAKSCNAAFAQLALELGSDRLCEYIANLGLTEKISIGELTSAAGNFNATDADPYELAWAGIGQSTDLVNPMSVLRVLGAIANNGIAVTPRLISAQRSADAKLFDEETAATLTEMMAYNVETNYGKANYPGLSLCAKSGTAEVGGNAAPHAWFVGFLENEESPLAFVVLIENGGSGSDVAGAVANTVLQSAVQRMK